MALKTPLRFGLPKGSLEQSTLDLLSRAGFKIQSSSRGYKPYINDPELEARLVRPQEMSRYVAQGFLDFGITGKDWIQEGGHRVRGSCATWPTARRRACPPAGSSPCRRIHRSRAIKDLQGKRIATELVETVRRYLASHNVTAEIEFSWGATEVKVPELVDAIVDLTETGSSLRANKLRIIATIIESYPQLIANEAVYADPEKRRKLEGFQLLLIGALNAREKVGLKMNVPRAALEKLASTLPALRNPTDFSSGG